jgi:tetratricopeptide (TPR) repeat protein
MQMGDHCKQSRKYEDAVHYYQQALGVKLIPELVKTNALNALAQIYSELYHADLAMHYFEKAREQARLINDPAAETLALSGLANLYYERGEKARALSLIARAQLLNRHRSADVEAGLLCLFAQIRGEEGRVKDAQNAFEAALSIYVRESDFDGQVRVLCSMSSLSLAGLNKQAAI